MEVGHETANLSKSDNGFAAFLQQAPETPGEFAAKYLKSLVDPYGNRTVFSP